MTTIDDHKLFVLTRLREMSGEYSALARASGCDPSTVAKLARRAREESLESVDMTVSTLSRLESYFSILDSETRMDGSLLETSADQAA